MQQSVLLQVLNILFHVIHYEFEVVFFFFKQKTAYEMRISDWSSDVCSSDLGAAGRSRRDRQVGHRVHQLLGPDAGEGQAEDGRQVRRFVAVHPHRTQNVQKPLPQRPKPRRLAVETSGDRQSVVWGKRVSVRVALGCRRFLNKKTKTTQ